MAHFEYESVPQGMEKHTLDHLTSQDLISVTSFNALIQGHLFNCKCEAQAIFANKCHS